MTRKPSINLFRTINGLPPRRVYKKPPTPTPTDDYQFSDNSKYQFSDGSIYEFDS